MAEWWGGTKFPQGGQQQNKAGNISEVVVTVLPTTSVPPVQMVRTGTPASRRYCGTIHFPTDHTQWADAAHCINTDPFTRFFICPPENCPTTEKLHVQF